jgi:hypothetical protein
MRDLFPHKGHISNPAQAASQVIPMTATFSAKFYMMLLSDIIFSINAMKNINIIFRT